VPPLTLPPFTQATLQELRDGSAALRAHSRQLRADSDALHEASRELCRTMYEGAAGESSAQDGLGERQRDRIGR
jgi:hypothetical protein